MFRLYYTTHSTQLPEIQWFGREILRLPHAYLEVKIEVPQKITKPDHSGYSGIETHDFGGKY